MDLYVIVLRILHVGGGTFWAGAVILTTRFLLPNARAIGPSAGPFLGRLMGEQGLGRAAGGAAIITILSGALLYWHDFGTVVPPNPMAIGLAIGALAAIALWLIGIGRFLPANRRLAELGARAAQGEEVGAELAAAARRRDGAAPWMLTLALVAVLAMAVARYL